MKKIRNIIIVGIFLAIWIIVLVVVVNNDNLKEEKSISQYVLIDKFNYWKYTDSIWEKIDVIANFDEYDEEINWKNYDVYVNNSFYKTLEFAYRDGEEYFFDENSKSYSISQEKILFNEDTYLTLKNFEVSDVTDEDKDITLNYLTKYNHTMDDLTVYNKYYLEDDSYLYIISNYPSTYTDNQSGLFYFVFYRKNNKNYLLLDIDYDEDISSYKLAWVIDAKNKYYNIVLSYTCVEMTCYDMYEYQNKKFTKVIGTEED